MSEDRKNASLFQGFSESSASFKIALTAVVTVWTAVLAVLIGGVIFTGCTLETPGQALQPTPGAGIPGMVLDPTGGPPGSSVTIQGEAWGPGSTVLVYLVAPGQTEPPNYATAGSVVDEEGRFTLRFVIPAEPDWENQGLATVIVRTTQGGSSAQAFFKVVDRPEEPTATPVASVEPTPMLTETPQLPTPTPRPGQPLAAAITDLNIRGGPGTSYPVLGLLRAGQGAEITGVSPDRGWWQIRFSGAPGERGWVSASYTRAENTHNVPIVEPPPLPATPTPTPTATPLPPTSTPPVIRDWRGEYYNNRTLSGSPALVRNDVAINFDWGIGSPAAGLPADDFSVRWTRDLGFQAGTYRFHARVDDGVRLWVDGMLVIDQWRDSAPTTYSADVNLSEGAHSLRMEYYEHTGDALAQLAWERLESYPDWKAEYYANRKLEGDPVLVRNETEINHDWGTGSPESRVPADNFSARWTRKVDFKDGTYLFRVRVDDGVRLWIDGTRVIDSWQDGSPRVIEAKHNIDDGKHQVRVEYYERHGGALIQLSWQPVEKPANKPPQADPGGPYSADEGSLVTFRGDASQDPDGRIVKYEWDFNYDGRTLVVDATGERADTRYLDGPATIRIALRVTDDKGATHTATTQVQVKNIAPAVEAGGPYTGTMGRPITLAGIAIDPGPIDQMSLDYEWDFGDGTQGSGPIVSHSYAQPGEYIVTLTVTDKDGAQGSDTASVQVSAGIQPPKAVISGPTSGSVGETLSFDASGSSDPDGNIESYAWNFGDGHQGDGRTVNHVYDLPGDYQVSLTVTDDSGLSDRATLSLHIKPPPPISPTAVITAPVTAAISQTVQFDGSGSNDSDGHIVSYAWNFGDSTIGEGISATHVYTQPGAFEVVLVVADDSGLTASASHVLQIGEPGSTEPLPASINPALPVSQGPGRPGSTKAGRLP